MLCLEPASNLPRPAASRRKRMRSCEPILISFSGYKDNTLLFRDGGGIQFDDGRSKTYEELLSNPDPEDELSQAYPTGPQSYSAPAVNFDPGRYRCAALFKKMYGRTQKKWSRTLSRFPGCLIPLTTPFVSPE